MKTLVALVFCMAAGSGLASAQTHQEAGLFVQGGAFATYEARSHEDIDANIALTSIGDQTAAAPCRAAPLASACSCVRS